MNDGITKCPHGWPVETVRLPEKGPGWRADIGPASCSMCDTGKVLRIYQPGDWREREPQEPQESPGKAEAQDVEDQGERSTAGSAGGEGVQEFGALAASLVLARLGGLEKAMGLALDRIASLEKTSAGKAETLEELDKLRSRIEAAGRTPFGSVDPVQRTERWQASAERWEAWRLERAELTCFVCGEDLGDSSTFAEPGVGRRHTDPEVCDPRPSRLPVLLESPWSGAVEVHKAYARAAMFDSLRRGEAPMASHLLYTQVLDDDDSGDRLTGMQAGWAWIGAVRFVAAYADLGISRGMRAGLRRAHAAGVQVFIRELDTPGLEMSWAGDEADFDAYPTDPHARG